MRGRMGSYWWGLWALALVVGCESPENETDIDAAIACEPGETEPCEVDGDPPCPGTRTCQGGRLGACEAPEERCDGVDNDCDGEVDEDFPGVGLSCQVGVGACRVQGEIACTFDGATALCNVLPRSGSAETCDGIDNDCDNRTDEEVPEGEVCDTGEVGVCNAGRTLCADGQVLCSQAASPGVETCDGLDNDCDGAIDESRMGGPLVRPCYDGPEGTDGVGACRGGTQTCVDGMFGACTGQVIPVDEVCDAADNDCNGAVDDTEEGCICPPGQPVECYAGPEGTRGVGPCVAGTALCLPDGSGTEACVGEIVPSAEVCDGIDNDCNGIVDDAAGVGEACRAGVGACARDGERVCDVEAGAVVCGAVPAAPRVEICNGVDDDCDGLVDDVDGAGLPCEAGVGACAAPGVQICDIANRQLVCEADLLPPSEETCNGIDDDCNGIADDVAGLGDACTAGLGICARDGVNVCGARGLECDAAPGEPAEETCNGMDDDCNGTVDDAAGVGEVCSNGVGACAVEGLGFCSDEGVQCDAVPGAPGEEVCNEIDDDCDGRTDEAGVCPEICDDGRDNDDDGATDCDDIEDCARDPFCAFSSCRAALEAGREESGIYLLRDAAGALIDVYCDLETDGGGWTLVGSTVGAMFDDFGVGYYADLMTLAPAGAHPGLFNGFDFGPTTDIRFACRAARAGRDAPMDVDLSFYRTPWYAEIAAAERDAQSCFSENNGLGFDEPPPQRRNNLTGEVIAANTGWGGGTFEGEDACGDTQDFTIDFDDRGMRSDVSDGTDWGEDQGRLKCGVAGLADGQWFVFVREVDPPAAEICDNGEDDDGDGAVDCSDFDCLDDPLCSRRRGELRLVDGFVDGSGRLELRYNGRWGTICDDDFGLPDAEVACRQLGYAGAMDVLSEFGGGRGTIWMDEVACAGNEDTLLECGSAPLGSGDCDHDQDVGVMCLLEGQCREDFHCTGGAVCVDGACFGGELCDDGADNDEDGLVDCDDPDCEPSDACAECLVDDACAGGQICVERVCIDGCRLDGQCAPGEICDAARLTCVDGCRVDAACGPGQICEGLACRLGCRQDDECAPNQICDAVAFACVAGCRDDAACGLGRICEPGGCVAGCRADPGCPAGSICDGGQCREGCRADADCGPGAICEASTCEVGCRDDGDCLAPGDICLDGQCQPLPAEVCDNGDDDDRDGDIDCADADCAAGPDCAVPIAQQQRAVTLDASLDVGDATWDTPAADCGPGDGGAHPYDALHIVNPTADEQRLRITAAWPAGRAGTLHVFRSPFAPPAGCVSGEPLDAIAIAPGETLVIAAASAAPGDRFGAYRVTVQTLLYDPVDYCRLQFPETFTGAPGDTTAVFGRVYEAGITDRSPNNDFSALMRAAVGFGPDGSDPAGPGWQWFDAAPNPGYDGSEPNNDEYFAELTVPEGVDLVAYDHAFRFSVDGGQSVTYCDLDGNGRNLAPGDPAAGYSPDRAGELVSDPIIRWCREACGDAEACGLIVAVYPEGYDQCMLDCTTNPIRRPQAQCIAEGFDPPAGCNPQVAFQCGLLP